MGIEFGSIFIVKYVVDNQKSFKKVTQLPLVCTSVHSNELFPGKNLPLGITIIHCKNFPQGTVLLGEEYPLRNKILLRNL